MTYRHFYVLFIFTISPGHYYAKVFQLFSFHIALLNRRGLIS